MGLLQNVMKALVPARVARAMEAESRLWVFRCPDGHEVSLWDLGGIRYKASGEPVSARKCRECGRIRKMKLTKHAEPPPPAP